MNLFSISIVLLIILSCLILSWQEGSSTSPPSPSPSPPTPISAASQTLRENGYSLFAAAIDAILSDKNPAIGHWNGTGTIFAPPDFAFFHYCEAQERRSSSPRPTFSLLNFHPLRQALKWNHLAVRSEGYDFLTFFPRKCNFKCKNLAGKLCIVRKKRPFGDFIGIWYPDLFVSENLVIHGVDGVLDPSDCNGEKRDR
ncbi:hypothetical protein BVC80_8201g8 [Macleaya cordata]|uniref:Uncharacterized protein n=1 Tax=Macleaya cordata TaxID=56857 RepID=A0A200QMP0_MACCD|nr:hypothetical protein BVC80_8201g8 [Macleaya cordata]